MSNVTLFLNSRRPNKFGQFPLVLRLTHNTETRLISLKISLTEDEWNPNKNEIKKTSHAKRDTAFAQSKLALAKSFLVDNERKIAKKSVNDVKQQLEYLIFKKEDDPIEEQAPSAFLSVYGKSISDRILETGKLKTAIWYQDAINSLIKFNNDKDIYLSDVDVTFLENYKANCLSKGQSKNSISARLRALRALMNKAHKEGDSFLRKDHDPFQNVNIPTQKTPKRAVSKDVINTIRTADLKKDSIYWNDRNYFLFMFNMQGMNFIDLAKLQCKQISEGRLRYIRSKNNKPFDVKLTKEAEEIVALYNKKKSPDDYLFPILKKEESKDPIRITKTSEQALHIFNKHIQKLAKECGIEQKITSYVIRHSWASAARKLGISTDIIGDGLGHNNYSTTEIYLQDFDNDVLDDANEKVTGV